MIAERLAGIDPGCHPPGAHGHASLPGRAAAIARSGGPTNAFATPGPYQPGCASRRAAARLRNLCLAFLMDLDDVRMRASCAWQQLRERRQHDRRAVGADRARQLRLPGAAACARCILRPWKDEPLVVDKWLGVEALSRLPGTVERVRELTSIRPSRCRTPTRSMRCSAASAAISSTSTPPTARGYGFMTRTDAGARPDQPAGGRADGAQFRALETLRAQAPRADEGGARASGRGSRVVERNRRSGYQGTLLICPYLFARGVFALGLKISCGPPKLQKVAGSC